MEYSSTLPKKMFKCNFLTKVKWSVIFIYRKTWKPWRSSMRIHRIAGHNFFSFDDFNIVINETPDSPPVFYIIDGINYDTDSENSSNGSGKSTLISESIFYNLFSRSLRGLKQKVKQDNVIKSGREQLVNEVEYFVNNDNDVSILDIQRIKKREGGSSVSVTLDNERKEQRGKRLTDKDIKNFIDLSPDIFSQIIVYYRDNINLLSMNYGQRLDFFKNIINLSVIDEYYAKFKSFKSKNDAKLKELQLTYNNVVEIINIISDNKDKYDAFINDKIKELELKLAEYEAVKIKDDTKLVEKRQELLIKVKEVNDRISELTNQISHDNKDIDRLKEQAQKIKKMSGGNCPVCQQEVSTNYVDNIINAYLLEIKKYFDNVKKCTKEKEDLMEEFKKYKPKVAKLEDEISQIKSDNFMRQNNIDSCKREIVRLKKEFITQQSNSDEISKLDWYNKKRVGFENAIVIRAKWAEAANYWYEAFAPKSVLRTAIIGKYIMLLSDTFEYYIAKLYNDEIIGEINIDDDGNIDIILYKDNYEINYWQLSSGERKRIDIALLLSLYEFTSYVNKNMAKFLILDECLDNLDGYGRECVIDTLVDMQKRHKIDIFLISHTEIPLDRIPDDVIIKKMLVTKRNKNSEIEVELN